MNYSDKDIESRVRGSDFSNPAHKERLRSRLLEQSKRLGAEDLDAVTGGVEPLKLPPLTEDRWAPWDQDESLKRPTLDHIEVCTKLPPGIEAGDLSTIPKQTGSTGLNIRIEP